MFFRSYKGEIGLRRVGEGELDLFFFGDVFVFRTLGLYISVKRFFLWSRGFFIVYFFYI